MTFLDESRGLWPNRQKRDILAKICSQEMWLSHAYTLANLVRVRHLKVQHVSYLRLVFWLKTMKSAMSYA